MVVKIASRVTLTPTPTLADLHERLGFVPLHRIRVVPPPGTATEADVIRFLEGDDKRLYELVDGTLVEKAVGTHEGFLAAALIRLLGNHVADKDLGLVGGADGPYRMLAGNIRYPDVSFVPWSELPDEDLPGEAIWDIIPAFAVEVLSPSNTAAEIDRKIAELFELGTKLIWVIDPPTESAAVHTPGKKPKRVGPGDTLEGGRVLPGFRLPLADLFAATRRRKKK
jgi:Uma2 family endonuclease